ncbi:MAG TPA: DUF5317 domain-containing protein [Candidatus Limnocylindrales bacterium]|nr:DUF5317 domain-containing protein [Candidatus Limnocylindrales bacterium]
MFIILAVPIGLVLGFLMGGRLDRLSEIRFEWAWLAVVGLAVQVLLFSTPIGGSFRGGVGEAIYVASTGLVLVAVWRNLRVPGLALVALGAISNLAAIVANGGVMPTTPEALAAAGLDPLDGFSNSAVLEDPAVAPLTDIFALPPWLPFANVFSIGDVLIALGVVIVVAIGMRRGDPASRPA